MFLPPQDYVLDFFSNWIYDLIGCLGTVVILITYAMLQLSKLESKSFIYSLLNLIGALLILFSLFFSWNLAAVFMEGAWVVLSCYGVINALRLRRRKERI